MLNHTHCPNHPHLHPIHVALILPIIEVIIIFTLYSSLFTQNYFLFICICNGIKCVDTLIGDVLMKIPSIPRGYILLIIRTYVNTADVMLIET
jgi:hypothetical protein